MEFFYNLKNSNDESNKVLGKFFLNSLYGKFAMAENYENIEIIDSSQFEEYHKNFNLLDYNPLDNNQLVVHYFETPKSSEEAQIKDEKKYPLNISIAVSSAIASYSRIQMHKITPQGGFNSGVKLYYTDTDSIITDQPLPSELVGSNLGQFKLVHDNIVEAYFPLPKIYGLVLKDGSHIFPPPPPRGGGGG